jgi:hypothetical protein
MIKGRDWWMGFALAATAACAQTPDGSSEPSSSASTSAALDVPGASIPVLCADRTRFFDAQEVPVTPTGRGRTLWVDAQRGRSGNDGLSEARPFPTIGVAMGTLAAGDTVRVKAGLYRERFSIPRSGTPGARIVIGAHGDGPVVVDASTAVGGWALVSGQVYQAPVPFVVTAVVVDDQALRPEFSVAALTAGRYYHDPAAKRIYLWIPGGGNPASHDVGVVADDAYQDGIALNNAHHVTLYGLTVRFAGGHGISVLGDGVRVEKCRLRFNGKAGVSVFGYGSTRSSGLEVIRNEVYFNVIRNWPRGRYKWGGWAMGVVSNGTPDVLYEGNVVYRNGGEGLGAYSGSGGVIRNNVAYDNWSVNIYVDNRPNVVVEGNLVYSHTPRPQDLHNNGDDNPGDGKNLRRLRPDGILTADEKYDLTPPANLAKVTIANNVIVSCRRGISHYAQAAGSALRSVRVLHNTIVTPNELLAEESAQALTVPWNGGHNSDSVYRNNLVLGGHPQAQLLSSDGPPGPESFAGLTMDRNLWYHPANGKPFHWGPSGRDGFDLDHATWAALPGPPHGGGDVVADPRLGANAAGPDGGGFRPQPGSEAIDRGTDAGVAADHCGQPRPGGRAPDIGAFEVNGALAGAGAR